MVATGADSPHFLPATWNLDAAGAIQKTLAIPLVGRAKAREIFPALGFADPAAERLLEQLSFAGTPQLARDRKTVWGSIVRSQVFDDVTFDFLAANPGARVLNLGAGLCTRRERAGASASMWIEADVPEVIAAKHSLAPAPEGVHRLVVDLEDAASLEHILDVALAANRGPMLVIAEGVLMFLEKDAQQRVLETLERRLPSGSQIVFDYMHPTVRRISRIHPSLKVTGASYKSGFEPAHELAAYPRLRALGLRMFTQRYKPVVRAVDRLLGAVFAGGSSLYDVALLRVEERARDRRDGGHGAVAAATMFVFAAAMAGSVLLNNPFAIAGLQVVAGLMMLRAFCLVHELSHGNLLKGRRANDVWGHLASLICVLPYYPWKRIHVEHHKWAGHKAQDPTESDLEFEDLKPAEQQVASAAWKLWLPLLSLSFSVRTFWNLPRLNKLFPKDKGAFLFSVLFIPAVHAAAIYFLGAAYLKAFLPGFVFFLFLLDPIMLSQHVGIELIPEGPQRSGEVKPVPLREQEAFARTIVFPRWFARHVLLGFNFHSLHHARPTLPGHLLDRVPFPATHQAHWLTWLRQAKGSSLGTLLARSGK